MRRSRWFLPSVAMLLALVGTWLWWVRPQAVDMAGYAPADSLLYLEANHPTEVLGAIAKTHAWKILIAESREGPTYSHWLQGLMRLTGIGPVQSVILARAQVAVVITELRTVEQGETLNIKSEGALIIETHTSERRIRVPVEEALKTLAEKTYGRPTFRRVTADGIEYVEWIAPEGSRQIVGVVFGSLVVIGTSEKVVRDCLAAAQGRRPSLKGDTGLNQMRVELGRETALTLGYVPPGNSAKLLAVGLPALLGRAPGDSDFQRLITDGAMKVFGSLGWASNTYQGGIEDRYLITLQPAIVARLKPTFAAGGAKSEMERLAPNDFYSVTSYKFAKPAAAWLSLKTAVSSQVDALSAIVFSSLLRSALLSYGVDDPESFLGAVEGEVLTLRLDGDAERSLLIARVHDRAALRQIITKKMSLSRRTAAAGLPEIFADSEDEFAAGLSEEFVVIGSPLEVRRYYETKGTTPTSLQPENLRKIAAFVSSPTSATVVTYTNDADRVRSFMSAINAAQGHSATDSQRFEAAIATLPYSVTETSLGDRGIERITRSPLGQFSSLLPLLFPQPASPATDSNQSR